MSTTAPVATPRRVYRRLALNAWGSLCMAGVGIAFSVLAVDAAPHGKGVAGTVAIVVLAGAVAVLGWYLAVRMAIQGVIADEKGVLIRNGLRSHRLRWDEIDHFEYGRCDPWPRIGLAVLRSGRRIAMVSLQRGYISHFPEQAVEALNSERQQHDAYATAAS